MSKIRRKQLSGGSGGLPGILGFYGSGCNLWDKVTFDRDLGLGEAAGFFADVIHDVAVEQQVAGIDHHGFELPEASVMEDAMAVFVKNRGVSVFVVTPDRNTNDTYSYEFEGKFEFPKEARLTVKEKLKSMKK